MSSLNLCFTITSLFKIDNSELLDAPLTTFTNNTLDIKSCNHPHSYHHLPLRSSHLYFLSKFQMTGTGSTEGCASILSLRWLYALRDSRNGTRKHKHRPCFYFLTQVKYGSVWGEGVWYYCYVIMYIGTQQTYFLYCWVSFEIRRFSYTTNRQPYSGQTNKT